jgi:hypothetical protein
VEAQRPAATLPENPAVSFQCRGAAEICSPLRAAVLDAFERDGIVVTRSGGDIVLTAEVTLLDDRIDRPFGTAVAVRTYSIEMDGASPRLDEEIPMAVSRTVSADPSLGAERFAEAGRLVAAATLERVRAFWTKRRQ